MLSRYFGFKEEPFGISPDPRCLFLSRTHQQALEALEDGFMSNRGFTAMIAPPGMGKTTLLFRFLEDVRESSRVVFLFDLDATCEPREFVAYVLRDLGITPAQSSAEMHDQLGEALIKENMAGRKFVIVIDEAQNLSEAVLERVRLLTNFENSRGKLIQVVLSGQPQLSDNFGNKYAGVGALACWLTAAQSIRIIRGGSVIAAMARGDTVNNMVSSLWRLSGLLLAIIVGMLNASITWFAVTALVGEIVALAATVIRLDSKHSISPKTTLMPAASGMACVLFAGAIKWLLSLGPHSFFNWLLLPMMLLLSAGAFLVCFRELRTAFADATMHFRVRMGWARPKASPTVVSAVPVLSGDIKD